MDERTVYLRLEAEHKGSRPVAAHCVSRASKAGRSVTIGESNGIPRLHMSMEQGHRHHMSAQFTAKTEAIEEKIAELQVLKRTLLESAALCPTPAEQREQQGNCGLLSSACC